MTYFRAHIKWNNEHISGDPVLIIDSAGLLNDIKINLTKIRNHNGDNNSEARINTSVQQNCGFSLMFRAVQKNGKE